MGQLCGWWLLCGMGHEQRRDPIHWPQALYLGMEQSIGQNTFQQVCVCILNPHHLRVGAFN